jgi:betaine-aldehyde dehydrogenase
MSTPAMTTGTSSDRAHGQRAMAVTGTTLTVAEHWIDGEWVGSDTVSESINPATGKVLGQWSHAGEAEARAAIAAARRAFDTSLWSRDRALRHKALSEMADRLDAHADELGPLVTKENGKKLSEGMLEAALPGVTLRHTAGQALTDTGISAEVAPGQWFSTYGEPAGVVGVIVPWNSPVILDATVPLLVAGVTTFAGQFCMTGSGLQPDTDMGPMIDKANVAPNNDRGRW